MGLNFTEYIYCLKTSRSFQKYYNLSSVLDFSLEFDNMQKNFHKHASMYGHLKINLEESNPLLIFSQYCPPQIIPQVSEHCTKMIKTLDIFNRILISLFWLTFKILRRIQSIFLFPLGSSHN